MTLANCDRYSREREGDWEAGKLAERGCLHKNEKRDQTSEIERDAKTSEEMSV